MARRIGNKGREVEINTVRSSVRKEIEKRYGSVAKFLHSGDAEKFGGRKIRCYLYDSGAINYKVISELARWLGIGELHREVIVTRNYKYVMTDKTSSE